MLRLSYIFALLTAVFSSAATAATWTENGATVNASVFAIWNDLGGDSYSVGLTLNYTTSPAGSNSFRDLSMYYYSISQARWVIQSSAYELSYQLHTAGASGSDTVNLSSFNATYYSGIQYRNSSGTVVWEGEPVIIPDVPVHTFEVSLENTTDHLYDTSLEIYDEDGNLIDIIDVMLEPGESREINVEYDEPFTVGASTVIRNSETGNYEYEYTDLGDSIEHPTRVNESFDNAPRVTGNVTQGGSVDVDLTPLLVTNRLGFQEANMQLGQILDVLQNGDAQYDFTQMEGILVDIESNTSNNDSAILSNIEQDTGWLYTINSHAIGIENEVVSIDDTLGLINAKYDDQTGVLEQIRDKPLTIDLPALEEATLSFDDSRMVTELQGIESKIQTETIARNNSSFLEREILSDIKNAIEAQEGNEATDVSGIEGRLDTLIGETQGDGSTDPLEPYDDSYDGEEFSFDGFNITDVLDTIIGLFPSPTSLPTVSGRSYVYSMDVDLMGATLDQTIDLTHLSSWIEKFRTFVKACLIFMASVVMVTKIRRAFAG